MKSRLNFASRWLKLSECGRRFKPSVLVVVMVALCGSVLVPVTAGAHGPTFTPRTETRRVAVYKMVPQPDVWGVVRTEDVFEDRQVQVGTEDVFEDRQVKIGTQPVQVGTERVKVGTEPVYGYKTELVKVVTYEERLTPVYGYRSVQYPCPPPDRPCYRRERYVTGYEPRTVAVVKWEWQRVRVQTGTRDVFETRPVIEHHDVFETRRVKVGTRPVFETRSIKTGTRDVMGWIPQPDKREFSHYKTQTFVDPNPDNGTYTHDPTEHVCPPGQYMIKSSHDFWAKSGGAGVDKKPTMYFFVPSGQVPWKDGENIAGFKKVSHWVEMDAHTGCVQPTNPFDAFPKLKTFWDYVTGPVKDALESAMVSVTKPLQQAQPKVYALVYHAVCTIGTALELVGEWLFKLSPTVPAVSKYMDQVIALAKRITEASKKAKVAAGLAGVAAVAIELLLCNFGVEPGDGDLPDLTETTPTTDDTDTGDTDDTDDGDTDDTDTDDGDTDDTDTDNTDDGDTDDTDDTDDGDTDDTDDTDDGDDPPKENPLGLPVVSQLPPVDHAKYALKFSESLTPQLTAENCTPWVYWAQHSRSLWRCLR